MAREVGLLLCGTPSGTRDGLAQAVPGLHRLAGDHLCAQEGRVRAWIAGQSLQAVVVAPCGPRCRERLATALSALDPLAVHEVDAEPRRGPRRFEALVRGKLRRALAGLATPPEGIRYRFPLDRGPVSRRDLLRFPIRRTAVPIPLLDRSACRSSWRCQRCVQACPLGAMAVGRGVPGFDRGRCEGCGYCISACPAGALRLPGVSLAELLGEVRGVLSAAGGPRVVVFDCSARGSDPLPAEAFRLALPCVGMLSLRWILAPLAEGATGILVLESAERCHAWHAGPRARAAVSAAQLVLSGLGVEGERVTAIASPRDAEPAVRRLAGLPSLGELRDPPPGEPPPELPEILRRLAERGGETCRPVSGESLPFGVAFVDRARCSLCGVCAATCPLGALSFSEGAREVRLAFDASRCDGCRACEASCPERAVTIRRELRMEALGEQRLLHRGRVVRCRRCGALVASANLVRAVRAKVGGDAKMARLFEHCPACRMVAALRAPGWDSRGSDHLKAGDGRPVPITEA